MSNVEAFATKAAELCAFLEDGHADRGVDLLRDLARLLTETYALALALPAVEPSGGDWPDPTNTPDMPAFGQAEFYWEVFDPYEESEPVAGSLTDDISDIYRDLKRGFVAYDAGTEQGLNDAVWTWRLHFEVHWGDHAVDALRALHRAICRGS